MLVRFLVAATLLLPSQLFGQSDSVRDIVDSIEPSIVRANRDGRGVTWFHPRGCLVPAPQGPLAFMTLQAITGSDYFGPVHWSASRDGAKSWTDPQPVPGMGRIALGDGLEEAVCDVSPGYHRRTDTVLALGMCIFYKGGRKIPFTEELPARPVYTIRRADGSWSDKKKLVWNDPRATVVLSCGCAQWLVLPDGDLLLPVSVGSKTAPRRFATTLLCGYDGNELTVKKVGRSLAGKSGRGFIEPSLTFLDGIYHMTIRSEDGKGYVATSKDGLEWSDPIAWAWQSGETLTMSTTQQHWLTHSDALYLVYTRKSAENATVFRWRAPLYLAPVDRKTLRLVQNSERIVFPIKSEGVKDVKDAPFSGNFHTMSLSANESLITDAETFPANRFHGDQLQARVRWKTPNRLED